MRGLSTVLLPVILLLLLCPVSLQARELGGVTLPEELAAGADTLRLKGAGIRSKWFFDLYVAGLYLAEESADAAAIVAAEKPMAIRLTITSGMIDSAKMEKGVREGFAKATGGQTQPLAAEIERFIAIFRPKVNEGDVYLFSYHPATGVAISRNGEAIDVIAGLPFKQALFGIWLGPDPAQQSLKKALLGG